jgi:hypothetical protein
MTKIEAHNATTVRQDEISQNLHCGQKTIQENPLASSLVLHKYCPKALLNYRTQNVLGFVTGVRIETMIVLDRDRTF